MNKSGEGEWDLVIKPKRSLFDLRLKEVWKYRDLLILFVRRDFVSFYKQTILGPIWFFIQPLFTVIIYTFLFSKLANLSTDGIPPALFYLAGITAWTYFSDCLLKTSNVLRDNAGIFGKVYFPRLITPLSIIISNLVKFGIQLILLFCLMVYYAFVGEGYAITNYIILYPFFIFLMAALGLGIGMIVAGIANKYRDIAMLLSFGIQLLMYATPIVYPLSIVTGNIRLLLLANPMTTVVEGIRLSLLGQGAFYPMALLYTVVMTAVILISGVVIFNRVEKDFVDTV
jgi:lipopolysaccharide transport system permease protein